MNKQAVLQAIRELMEFGFDFQTALAIVSAEQQGLVLDLQTGLWANVKPDAPIELEVTPQGQSAIVRQEEL